MKKTVVVLAVAALCSAFFVTSGTAAEKGTVDPKSGKACYECHRSKVTGAYVHSALADKECTPCHEVSAGSHQKDHKLFGVKDKSAALCYQCHDSNSKAKSVHPVIEAESCLVCHAKHNSPQQYLLKVEADCFNCHEKALVEQKQTTKGTAFRDGQDNLHFVHAGTNKISCLACHNVHASAQLHLITPKGKKGAETVTTTYTTTDKGGNCTTSCHDAMGYERK
ncbi:cytochrome c3 family protein [Geomonas sp. RF6]|uniref:cytochrome c3 family protein n=1 Tax=Geomonas sp. RF6 TaxID=2897342 RepID=UPI001E6243F5|nr:cytochrome c3 family protein [Geomonas sp. RF6]UFS71951.1 cytochrome c3 family protein [Geomonas sp. RF6]